MSSYYSISFRLAQKHAGGKTYNERRDSLVANARAEEMGYWEETTSFILAESTLQTPDFARRVCQDLSAKDDMVLVFDPADMSANYFGAVKNVDVLKSFFPKAERIG